MKNTCLQLLEILKADIKATFFVTGKWGEANPELVKEIVKGGHDLATTAMDTNI